MDRFRKIVVMGAVALLGAGATRASPQSDFASARIIMPGCEAYLAQHYDEPTLQIFRQGVCAGQIAGVGMQPPHSTQFALLATPF